MRKTTWMVTLGAGLMAATAAWAVSLDEVQADAETLRGRLQEIQAAADACPDGACANAAGIVDAYQDVQPDLVTLRDDRAALGSCNCASLDELIAQVEGVNDSVGVVLGEWEDDHM